MCVQRVNGSPPSRLSDWAGWATPGWWGTPPRGEPAGWPRVTGCCWWHFEKFVEGSVWEKEKNVWNKWNNSTQIKVLFLYHWFFFINWKTISKCSEIALTALHASFPLFKHLTIFYIVFKSFWRVRQETEGFESFLLNNHKANLQGGLRIFITMA